MNFFTKVNFPEIVSAGAKLCGDERNDKIKIAASITRKKGLKEEGSRDGEEINNSVTYIL